MLEGETMSWTQKMEGCKVKRAWKLWGGKVGNVYDKNAHSLDTHTIVWSLIRFHARSCEIVILNI